MISAADPRRGATRGVCALVLAAVAVGLAGAAHTYVDGCLDLRGLLLSLGLCWPAAVLVLGSRRRLPALVGWVTAAQVVTHVVVSLTCGGAGHATPARVLFVHATAVLVTTASFTRADARLWLADAIRRALRLVLVPLLLAAPVLRRPTFRFSHRGPALAGRLVSPRVLRGPPSGQLALTS